MPISSLDKTKRKRNESGKLGITSHGIEVACTPAEVVVEGLCDLEDTFDVLHGQRSLFVHGESLGGADGILDLIKSRFVSDL